MFPVDENDGTLSSSVVAVFIESDAPTAKTIGS